MTDRIHVRAELWSGGRLIAGVDRVIVLSSLKRHVDRTCAEQRRARVPRPERPKDALQDAVALLRSSQRESHALQAIAACVVAVGLHKGPPVLRDQRFTISELAPGAPVTISVWRDELVAA